MSDLPLFIAITEEENYKLKKRIAELKKEISALSTELDMAQSEIEAGDKMIEQLKKEKNIAESQVVDFCYFYNPTRADFNFAKEKRNQHDKEVVRNHVNKLLEIVAKTYIEDGGEWCNGANFVLRQFAVQSAKQLKEQE